MGFEKTGRTGLGDNAQHETTIQGRVYTGDDAVRAREDMASLGIDVDETETDHAN
jgi:hypothetical protein